MIMTSLDNSGVRSILWSLDQHKLLRTFSRCSIEVKLHLFQSYCTNLYCSHLWHIYTTKIYGVVGPPNISESVAGRLIKLAHRPRIASTMIKLISKPICLPILLILVKTIQRIVADHKSKLSPPFHSAVSVPSLGHPGSGKILSLFTVLCDYSVWVTETGAPGSGKTIQPIRI